MSGLSQNYIKNWLLKQLEDGDSLNKAVENAIAVYLSDGRANDINKDIKEFVKMR